MLVRIFTGKTYRRHKISSLKKLVVKKIRHWQKKSLFFADSFSSDKIIKIVFIIYLQIQPQTGKSCQIFPISIYDSTI